MSLKKYDFEDLTTNTFLVRYRNPSIFLRVNIYLRERLMYECYDEGDKTLDEKLDIDFAQLS